MGARSKREREPGLIGTERADSKRESLVTKMTIDSYRVRDKGIERQRDDRETDREIERQIEMIEIQIDREIETGREKFSDREIER